ncbi:MAG: Alpha N-terminal protein methyltransferase 1 [Thelocarpon superellum]|nr:MAG: Alpha N-terminal protein methyltransferase 1 [Thelocarpon superellum]
MPDSADPADSNIDHDAAMRYWSTVKPDVSGMLGGYPQVSRIDLQGSANFLAKVRRLSPSSPSTLERGVDCGAGIGRVTQGLLARVCDVVDLVEPVETFVHELRQGEVLAEWRLKGRVGNVFAVGLEDWDPPPETYHLFWNQWCLGHLTDEQVRAYLGRCRAALKQGGWIMVKENMSTHPEQEDIFDDVDSSVTRSHDKFLSLFRDAQLHVVRTEIQTGFPRELGLYPVRQYALRPVNP